MSFVDPDNLPSPAPTYSATFHPHDMTNIPRPMAATGTSKNNDSKPSYYRFVRDEPSAPAFQLQDEAPLKDSAAQPDYRDSNHPHFARSAGLELPARNRMPAKRILVPWLLFAIFFLTTLWFTSILVGARFLSIIRPGPPSAQEIHIYIDGELLHGNLPVPTGPLSATLSAMTSTATSFEQAPSSTTSLPAETPAIGNDLGRVSSDVGARIASAPTGFVTTTRAEA